MTRCVVSWCRALDPEQSWPGGDWQHCAGEVVASQMIRLTDAAIITLGLCAAHSELFDAVAVEDDGTFMFVRGEPV